jgi:hypothetical protein
MRRRTLLGLGGAAAAAVGGAILLTPDRAAPPPPSASDLAFPALPQRLGNAAAIEVTRHDGTLVVRRAAPDRWVLPAKAGYPVRPERVRELLVGLTELRLTEPRTANPEMLDRLGLDDPSRPAATSSLLRVLDAQGAALAELVVGRRRVRTQGNVPESVYVRRPSETQAWLAEGRLPLDSDPNLWIDRDLANLPRDRVRTVSVNRAGEPPLVLRRGPDVDDRLSVVEPAATPELDEISLDEVARGFEFLTLLDVREAASIPGERIGTGRFELTDNLLITVTAHRDGETLWALLAAEGDEEAARLNARWQGWAYQLGQWKEKAFVPRLADLRKQEAAPEASAPEALPPEASPAAPQ